MPGRVEALALLARQVALDHAGVGPGVGGDHVDLRRDARTRLQFQAARAHLAGLHQKGRIDRIRREHVLALQVEERGAQHHVFTRGLVSDADFVLRPAAGLEAAVVAIAAAGGFERLAETGIRRQAVVGQVHDTRAARECRVLVVRIGGRRMQGAILRAHVVMPPAQQHHDLVRNLDLILQVDAKAMLGVAALLPRQGHDVAGQVHRIEDIDGRQIAAQAVAVVGRTRVVEACKKRLRDGAGLEALLDVGVDRLHRGAVVKAACGAGHPALRRRIHVALQQDIAHVEVCVVIAHRLAELQRVVERVLDQHGQRGRFDIESIVVGLAQKARPRDLAVRVGPERTGDRHFRRIERLAALIVGQERDRSGRRRTPRQGGREVGAIIGAVIDELLAFAEQAGQTIGPHASLIDGAADVRGNLPAVEAAAVHIDFTHRFAGRALGHGVDDAARRRGAVQHR